MWSRVEKEYDVWDWDYYIPIIEKIIESGFKIVIMLDAGGRLDFDDQGNPLIGTCVLPNYVIANHDLLQMDFEGNACLQLNFSNKDSLHFVSHFYKNALSTLGSRFKDHIFAIAISVHSECEVKYGQNNYVWRDYSKITKDKFYDETGLTAPVVNYGRPIAANPGECIGYSAWMRFREKEIVSFVSQLSALIRAHDFLSMAYFGEFFTSHDAISQVSVIGELAGCIDCVAIDYNFYSGWDVDPNPWRIPLMANYCRTLGYKFVFGGYYVERWRDPVGAPGSPVKMEIWPVVAESILEARHNDLIDGIEIGGLGNMNRDLRALSTPLMRAAIEGRIPANQTAKKYRIGIYCSHENFEWFVGEWDQKRNIHQQSVTASFALLAHSGSFEPIIISEKTFDKSPSAIASLDAIYIPHQPFITDAALRPLRQFAESRALVQDLRAGEWGDDGRYRGDWMHDLFGIGGVVWENGGEFVSGSMPANTISGHSSHALMSAEDKATILEPSLRDPDIGLIIKTQRTIAFGYIPAIIPGLEGEIWKDRFLREIAILIDEQNHN